MSKLPNISPQIFTLTGTAIGFILIEQLNQTEQNAIGNWLQLIGQMLETNAAYPVQDNNNNSNNDTNSNSSSTDNDTDAAIAALNKTLNAIKEELENLKKYNL